MERVGVLAMLKRDGVSDCETLSFWLWCETAFHNAIERKAFRKMGVIVSSDGISLDTARVPQGSALFVPVPASVLRALLDVNAPAINRCYAASRVPLIYLLLFMEKRMAYLMRYVAAQLCAALQERARTMPRASLRLLIFASRGKTPREQIERWDEYVLSATCEIVKAKRAEKKTTKRTRGRRGKHQRTEDGEDGNGRRGEGDE